MVKMVLSASQTQADSVSTKSKSNNQGYETVISSLNLFVNEHRLSSQAYDNGKAYYQSVLIPFVKAGILLTEAIENACKKFTETYQAEVDSCDLDSELLEQQISEVQSSINSSEQQKQRLTASKLPGFPIEFQLSITGFLLDNALRTKQDLEQKLQKLLAFEASSPAIFTEIASLKEAFNTGKAQTDVAWTDGSFKIPTSSSLSWTQTVAGKWETREQRKQKELEAKIKEQNLPKTKADIARDYHWSTNYNMYVNNKTGLPSPEVTALYNQLTMAEHAPQKNPQLEFFNEMLRTGKHPLTGKDITDAERANAHMMIYSLALQPFVGAWALSKVPQGYDDISTTKNVNKSEPMKQKNDFATEPFLPEEYYKNNYSSMDGVPNSKMEFNRLGSSGSVEKSVIFYDGQGKQSMRIDFSDHGNSLHHTNPHIHEFDWFDGGRAANETKYFLDDKGIFRLGEINKDTNAIQFLD